jgi:hypothetical protein
MVRVAILSICLGSAISATGQNELWTERRGLIMASGAIDPGFMLHQPFTNIYVTGQLAWFAEERISFRGQGSWFVDSQQTPALLKRNDQLSAGVFYHFGKDRVDLNVGVEPGISFTQLTAAPEVSPRPVAVVPTVAIGGGLTFFVWDHFHFFAGLRYLRSALHGTTTGTIRLDELMVNGGLGFQIKPGRKR